MSAVDGEVRPRVPDRWTEGLRSLNCEGFRLRGAGAAPLRPNSPPCHGPCQGRARAKVVEFGNPRFVMRTPFVVKSPCPAPSKRFTLAGVLTSP